MKNVRVIIVVDQGGSMTVEVVPVIGKEAMVSILESALELATQSK